MSKKKKNPNVDYYFRVVCEELDMVLFIKSLSLKDETAMYDQVRKSLVGAADSFSTEDYKVYIVKSFLKDADKFIEDDDSITLSHLYNSIVSIYPAFSLEFVCNDVNTETFLDGDKSEFIKNLKEQLSKTNPQSQQKPFSSKVSLSTLDDVIDLEQHLKSNIVGQREAIDSVVRSVKLMAAGLSNQTSMFFVGPTGVGKTELARLLGEKYSGHFFKINCAEYAGQHEYAKLIGAPPGYVGHTEKSILAEKAEQSDSWVFLFDEIEKAHHKLYDFLLSLLDDGTCTDNLGNILNFSKSIFIFTSNKGIGEIKQESLGFDRQTSAPTKEHMKTTVMNSVKKHFSPEFLNRIDDIVYFSHLSTIEVKKIAKMQLEKLPVDISNNLVNYVVSGGYSQDYGARNIARFIKKNVSVKVADAILKNEYPKNIECGYKTRITNGSVRIIDTIKPEEAQQ